MTFLFLILCVFGGVAIWSNRKKVDKPVQYDWDQAI